MKVITTTSNVCLFAGVRGYDMDKYSTYSSYKELYAAGKRLSSLSPLMLSKEGKYYLFVEKKTYNQDWIVRTRKTLSILTSI